MEWERRCRSPESRCIEHRCDDPKAAAQFVGPLQAQSRRAQHECSLAPASLPQLGEHERCLNRLAEAYLVGKEEPRGAPANERERRLELKRKNIDRGSAGRMERAVRTKPRKAGLQISHPSSSRDNTDCAARRRENGTVEWVQKAGAAPIAGATARRCQMNDDAVVECRGVLDDPPLATCNNRIAGSEGEWHVLQ
jgi:hypothetical protein